MMKVISTISIAIIGNIKALTYGFLVSDGIPLSGATISGPNEEYVIVGTDLSYKALLVNWDAEQATVSHSIQLSSNPNIVSRAIRFTSGWTESVVLS